MKGDLKLVKNASCPIADFLREREDWLTVKTVPNEQHGNFDVVLILDGSYMERADAEEVASLFAGRLAALLRGGHP